MARKCFYSFHYKPDNWRVSTIRNIGVIEGNQTVSDNDWETVTKGGATAIEKWIADQMYGKSCTIVMIGEATADRKWIDYEIKKAWNDKKGVLGIHIHNILDKERNKSNKGKNPFAGFTLNGGTTPLSNVAMAYDPPYWDSKDVYSYIADNVEGWVDAAIKTRQSWG